MTCQLLLLTNEEIGYGKREKVMHLNKDISAVKTRDYLQFEGRVERITDVRSTKEHLRKVIKNNENDSNNNNTNEYDSDNDDRDDDDNDDAIVSNSDEFSKNEKKTLKVNGVTVIHDKVN